MIFPTLDLKTRDVVDELVKIFPFVEVKVISITKLNKLNHTIITVSRYFWVILSAKLCPLSYLTRGMKPSDFKKIVINARI